ncbi:hypothetical protein [Vibrio vulnificus]|uniref:hypothetical protein n=1 Tax=Vibrio vulnificus TaxID=672 RepID=UPI001E4ABDD2|nr:hypothetical protein [Vibrio vulnificus]
MPKPSHRARYTRDPRVREDDKNKKRKSRAKFSGKEQKTQHTAATPPTVIPVHTGDPFIHTCQKPRLEMYSPQQTTTNNKALKPNYSARYTRDPRVREDDEVRELIRTTSNTNNKALKPSYSARYTITLRVREDDKNKKRKSRAKFSGKEQKNSAHRRHAPNCHSRACGDPYIHTCQKPRLEMHSPQQTTTKAKPTTTPAMKR